MARKKSTQPQLEIEIEPQIAALSLTPEPITFAKVAALGVKFDNEIVTPFAKTGLKMEFPTEPQPDGLINQQEGFTIKYRTPINAGGAYIKMENFNQIINETQAAIAETQDKCVLTVNNTAPDPIGNVVIPKATETENGVIALASVQETADGIDNLNAVTPYALKSAGFRPGFGVFIGSINIAGVDKGATFQDGESWWLRCTGSTRYNKSDYPVLASLLGSTYGAADPDTFAIPDMSAPQAAMRYYIFAGLKATTPAPLNLTAVNVTALSVRLNWQPPISGGTPVSYNIYSSAQPFIGYSKRSNVTTLEWVDTEPPTTSSLRYYKVAAVFAGGRESSMTDYISAPFLIAPASPTVELRGKDILVSLNIPLGQSSLQQYTASSGWVTVKEPALAQNSIILTNAGEYRFRYRLYVGSTMSAWGAERIVNIINPIAPLLTINARTKTLNWTNPSSSGKLFEIYRNGALITSTASLSYVYNGMVAGDTFFIKSFSAGLSSQSNNAYYIGRKTFAGTTDGVLVSTDNGANWVKV